jgi:hypothetical protein
MKYALLFSVILVMVFTAPLQSKVTRMEILIRQPFAEGMSFGTSGGYEVIKGRLFYEVNPDHPANTRVVDIKLAPRNKNGNVEFSGDFVMLKPVDLSKGNHRLLYDVNNRGNLIALIGMNDAPFNNLPVKAEHAGSGFLMREGYTMLWSAWNWDVTPGRGRLQMDVPAASDNGKPIIQKIAAEIVLSFDKKPRFSHPLAWGSSRCYPPIDPGNKKDCRLTVRDEPRGKRTLIPPAQWAFGRWEDNTFIADPVSLYVKAGLQPGKIYELIYTVKAPRVVGLGLAGARDAISFFRFDIAGQKGNANPLAVKTKEGKVKPDPEYAYIFGVSQSGRFITHMIYEGFHVDERSRMVFDGARIHVAGGGKGGFNHRFAQTTHHPSDLEGNYMPADFFPFNFAPQIDPLTGKTGDVLALAKGMGKIPYIMITNNELEYWTRSASLIHTDVSGKKDAQVHAKVRIYLTAGAPHRNSPSRTRHYPLYEHSINPINHYAISRALMRAMDQWVSRGAAPPPSRYPRINRGELITAAEHKNKFPAVPGMRHPGRNLMPPRVDYGPHFWTKGIFTVVPPEMGAPYRTMVPAPDKDGNTIAGIRLPELSAPLGTYQGWNPRQEKFGAPNYLGRFEGSFWPFALTEKERNANNDPRPSIEARYPSKDIYVQKVREAVKQLVKDRFMLEEDAEKYIRLAEQMVWPPGMIDGKPFWKTR